MKEIRALVTNDPIAGTRCKRAPAGNQHTRVR